MFSEDFVEQVFTKYLCNDQQLLRAPVFFPKGPTVSHDQEIWQSCSRQWSSSKFQNELQMALWLLLGIIWINMNWFHKPLANHNLLGICFYKMPCALNSPITPTSLLLKFSSYFNKVLSHPWFHVIAFWVNKRDIILKLLLLARELKGQNCVRDANLLNVFNADSTMQGTELHLQGSFLNLRC